MEKKIAELLLLKLYNRGLLPVEIPRLIRDVFNVIKDGGEFTARNINERLVSLGWKEQVIDEFTYELIIFLLESDQNDIMHNNLHGLTSFLMKQTFSPGFESHPES